MLLNNRDGLISLPYIFINEVILWDITIRKKIIILPFLKLI